MVICPLSIFLPITELWQRGLILIHQRILVKKLYLVRPGEFPFVGLENYLKISRSRVFWAAIGRTFYFTGVSVGVAMILGLGMALVLNQDFKGRAFVRGLIILPWALSSVVNGMMWKWIYDGSYGALNGLLLQLGWIDSYKVWLADPRAAMDFVIMAEIWKETPVGVLFILASLQTVPSSLYEPTYVSSVYEGITILPQRKLSKS